MLYLHGMGHYHPPNIITNEFISELDIGSDEQWILERVGIKSRRTSLDLDYIKSTRNSNPRAAEEASMCTRAQCAALAARLAMERAGITCDEVGMVVSGSSSPGCVCPAEASAAAAELGIEAPCFDVNSACSTFIVQLTLLSSMSEQSLPDFILTLNMESLTHSVDYSDRNTAPLFGDGCSAAIVSRSRPSTRFFINPGFQTMPQSWDKAVIFQGGHFFQEGRAVQGYAIRKTTELLQEILDRENTGPEGIKFVGHQANFMMLSNVCRRCGVPEDNHWSNVVEYGNTGCAGAPAALSQNWDNLTPGVDAAMAVVGGGLTYGGVLLKTNGESHAS